MNILISAFKKDRQAGAGLFDGFNALGKKVRLIFPDKFFWRLPDKNIIRVIKSFKPDLYISIGGEDVSSATLGEIKQRYKIPVIAWITNEPAVMADSRKPHCWLRFVNYDHLLVVDELWQQSLQMMTVPKTYLPWAGNNIYRPLGLKKDIDILFVGEMTPANGHFSSGWGRALILNKLLKANLPITAIAPGIRKFFYYFPELKNYRYINRSFSDYRLNQFYNRSKIIIYINDLMLKTDFDQAIFNIALSKNFVITDSKINQNKLFGSNLVTIKNFEELLDKVRHYLTHENERRPVTAYTYRERAEKIITTLGL